MPHILQKRLRNGLRMENNSICFNSPVGYISVEANNTHVLSIRFANGPQKNRESTVLLNLVQEQFSAYFNGTLTAFDLPLEFTGTDFQRKVWQHLYFLNTGSLGWGLCKLPHKWVRGGRYLSTAQNGRGSRGPDRVIY